MQRSQLKYVRFIANLNLQLFKELITTMDTIALARKVRHHIIDMTNRGNSSHVASALSIADIMAVLYGKIMHTNPKNPELPTRDRFILSKGHAGAAVYATLAECGFFDPKILETHFQDGSVLSGHVSHKGVPGVDFSTGSLGHGLPVACGMAYSMKLKQSNRRAFCLLGDGECDEGSNWEAILFAAHHELNNLIAIIDYNKLQSLTTTTDTLDLEPFVDKWRAFNWHVIELDGHNHQALLEALNQHAQHQTKPTCIIAHTTKGKGVSYMENKVLWHYRPPQGKLYDQAKKELNSK